MALAPSTQHSAWFEFFPQRRSSNHPLLEVLDRHPLVRRVRVFARQAEPHQQDRGAEYALEVADDGNGATLSSKDGLTAECPLERTLASVEQGAVELRSPRAAAVQRRHHDRDFRRNHATDVIRDQRGDLVRRLIWYQAATHLRHRPRGEDCFGALASVAAEQPVHLERWPGPEPFERRIPGFTAERG